MSHFTFTRAAGAWNTNTALLSSEMAGLDAKTFAAINGDGGGTWAPASLITIGGAGVSLTTPATFAATTTTGAATFHSIVTFDNEAHHFDIVQFNDSVQFLAGATAHFSDTVTFNANVSVSNTSLWTFNAPVTFSSTALHSDTVTFNGAAHHFGVVQFNNTVQFLPGGTANFNDLVVFNANVSVSNTSLWTFQSTAGFNAGISLTNGVLGLGVGGWISEKFTAGTNSDMIVDPADFTAVLWENSTLTVSRLCTLSSASRSGATVWLRNNHAVSEIQVIDQASGTALNNLASKAGFASSAVFKKFGSTWKEILTGNAL